MPDAPVPQGYVIDPAAPARRLVVVQLLPALENGGAERSTLEVARALVVAGHRSVVISAGGLMVRQLEAEGSEHVTLDIGSKSLRSLTRIGTLRRTLAAVGPDIVHARSRMPAWLAWVALRSMRPKPAFVTTVHGLNSPGAWSGIMIRGDRVIAVSQSVRDFLLGHYPRVDAARLTVIPRGIDPEAFPYGYRAEPAWREAFFAEYPQLAGAPLLTLPGRGTRLKGHADAIALIAGLRERGIDARLGDLPSRNAATGRGAGRFRHRGVLAAAQRRARRLRRVGPGAAIVEQARELRPHRDRGAVAVRAGARLCAWRRRRIAGRGGRDGRDGRDDGRDGRDPAGRALT